MEDLAYNLRCTVKYFYWYLVLPLLLLILILYNYQLLWSIWNQVPIITSHLAESCLSLKFQSTIETWKFGIRGGAQGTSAAFLLFLPFLLFHLPLFLLTPILPANAAFQAFQSYSHLVRLSVLSVSAFEQFCLVSSFTRVPAACSHGVRAEHLPSDSLKTLTGVCNTQHFVIQ